MRGKIKVVATPKTEFNNGSQIFFDGKLVACEMNVTETFMVLGGLLAKRGPTVVEMTMEEPENGALHRFYAMGRDFASRQKKVASRLLAKKTSRKTASRSTKRG